MSNRIYTIGALALGLVLFLAINIAANTLLTGTRLDLTQHRLFTLSKGTLHTLSHLDEPVHLRLYLSQELATRLPSVSGYASRVRELLSEYALRSHGKVKVTVIDPEPFSDEEDRAVGYGLKGIPLSDGESTFYFGLVGTNSLDNVQTIPYLSTDREEFLEYDVTKLIYTLGNPKRKVIGLISSLPLDGMTRQAMMGGQPRPWLIMQQIQQLFQVQRLPASTKEIPAKVDVLMLVHPKKLSRETQYAIDQFVLRGGHLLAFVDPNTEADRTQSLPGMPPLPQPSDLDDLLKAWGVRLHKGVSVGDLQLALKVRSQQGDRVVTSEYPPWMNVPPQLQNHDDIVTSELGNLTFASPGALEPIKGATTRFIPLVHTTDSAMLIANHLIGPMADLDNLKREYKPAGKSFVLAARIEGPAKSAFDGPVEPSAAKGDDKAAESGGGKDADTAASKAKDAPAPYLAHSKQDINVIVIADADMLQDQFWVQVRNFFGQQIAVPIAANANLVVNALENLSGSADLISVRSRGRFLRPFTVVNRLREQAELKFRQKETQLLDRLKETEKRLDQLQKTEGSSGLMLTNAQREEIERFRLEKVRIRKELRDVRAALRKDIENLEAWLKFVNIGLVPILIGIGGMVVGVYRVRHRRTSRAA